MWRYKPPCSVAVVPRQACVVAVPHTEAARGAFVQAGGMRAGGRAVSGSAGMDGEPGEVSERKATHDSDMAHPSQPHKHTLPRYKPHVPSR